MLSDRSIIQRVFMELFALHDLKIPDENLRDGTPGSLPYGSGRVMFAFGIDDAESGAEGNAKQDARGGAKGGSEGGTGFMEYYAHHRIGGDARGRIYEDGRHVSLPELCTMIVYNPAVPGDYERREKENREEYERIMKELIDVGIFSGGPVPGSLVINSHLVLRKKEEEGEGEGEGAREKR